MFLSWIAFLSRYVATAQNGLPFSSSVSLREPPSPQGEGFGCAPHRLICRSSLALPRGELSAELTERATLSVLAALGHLSQRERQGTYAKEIVNLHNERRPRNIPVGADASVRPLGNCGFADGFRENGCACRRADRVVRPYRTLCNFADGVRDFAGASCREGQDPPLRYDQNPLPSKRETAPEQAPGR